MFLRRQSMRRKIVCTIGAVVVLSVLTFFTLRSYGKSIESAEGYCSENHLSYNIIRATEDIEGKAIDEKAMAEQMYKASESGVEAYDFLVEYTGDKSTAEDILNRSADFDREMN
jgi:hypothetical protein